MTDAYTNKLLMIDLSCSSLETFSVPDALKADFIGGKGFGAKLLYDKVPPGTDPLGKDNLLMFMTGPLTGTMAPAMRGCVVTKSPLTGIFLDSYFGGSFAPEIKYAGYDGIIIKGCAQNPSYIWINDDHLSVASDLRSEPRRIVFPEALSRSSHHPEWMQPVLENFRREIFDPTIRGRNITEAKWCARIIDLAYRSYQEGSRPIPV